MSPTLNAMDNSGETYATVLTTYNIYGGNPRSDRPEGGFYVNESDATKTLDASGGLNPNANQGGVAIVGTLQSRDGKGLNHEGARDGKAIIETRGVRRLTPLECERLQGFPDNWTDGQADSNRYKQTGNAVAVPVADWIIRRLLAVDEANLAHTAFCTELQVMYGEHCACGVRQ